MLRCSSALFSVGELPAAVAAVDLRDVGQLDRSVSSPTRVDHGVQPQDTKRHRGQDSRCCRAFVSLVILRCPHPLWRSHDLGERVAQAIEQPVAGEEQLRSRLPPSASSQRQWPIGP